MYHVLFLNSSNGVNACCYKSFPFAVLIGSCSSSAGLATMLTKSTVTLVATKFAVLNLYIFTLVTVNPIVSCLPNLR